eukprot:3424437-Prymnesium_polylepis.1
MNQRWSERGGVREVRCRGSSRGRRYGGAPQVAGGQTARTLSYQTVSCSRPQWARSVSTGIASSGSTRIRSLVESSPITCPTEGGGGEGAEAERGCGLPLVGSTGWAVRWSGAAGSAAARGGGRHLNSGGSSA